jgi:hypothetical protein
VNRKEAVDVPMIDEKKIDFPKKKKKSREKIF